MVGPEVETSGSDWAGSWGPELGGPEVGGIGSWAMGMAEHLRFSYDNH